MKRTIAIVAGGDSSEHDVSLHSAANILSYMDTEKYDSYIVKMRGNDWHVDYHGTPCPIDRNDFSFTAPDGHHAFDFAYITIHGTPGENGILQGYFDLVGIPYSTSGVLVEALTFNKFALNNYLRSLSSDGHFHIADSILVHRDGERPSGLDVEQRLGYPCFVKPNAGGSSFGVTKVKTAAALSDALDKAFLESSDAMIERFVAGTEITCGCYKSSTGEIIVLPITEVVTSEEFFDYDAKYNGKVSEITPARIAPETAERVGRITSYIYEKLDCYGLIRIDYILSGNPGEEAVNLLEINTTPGMTATSFIPQQVKAAGLDITNVLTDIIEGKLS